MFGGGGGSQEPPSGSPLLRMGERSKAASKKVATKTQRKWEEAGGVAMLRKKGDTEAQRHRGARQGRRRQMAETLRVSPIFGWER